MSKTHDASIPSLFARIEIRINFLIDKLRDIAKESQKKTLTDNQRDVLYRKAVKIMKEIEPFKDDILKVNPKLILLFEAITYEQEHYIERAKKVFDKNKANQPEPGIS